MLEVNGTQIYTLGVQRNGTKTDIERVFFSKDQNVTKTLIWLRGYDILNSVHFTGSQYVEIGFTPNKNSIIYMNANFLSVGYCGYDTKENGGGVAVGRGNTGVDFCLYTNAQNQVTLGTAGGDHIYYFGNGFQYRDGESKGTRTWTATSSPRTFLLGALNTDYNGVVYYCNMRLSRFIVMENGTKKFDIYPARRRSDNVIGLYNTVNNAFYVPKGTLTAS